MDTRELIYSGGKPFTWKSLLISINYSNINQKYFSDLEQPAPEYVTPDPVECSDIAVQTAPIELLELSEDCLEIVKKPTAESEPESEDDTASENATEVIPENSEIETHDENANASLLGRFSQFFK